ncbi:c-type cytochrome biogenesis protein CcsB, partial [Paraburkholderia sp. SIMBA_030]
MELTQSSPDSGVPASEHTLRSQALPSSTQFDERPFLKRLGMTDWLFALAMVAG